MFGGAPWVGRGPGGGAVGHPQRLYDAMVAAAAENVLRALRGEPPLYVRNPDVLPVWRDRVPTLTKH